MPTLILSQLSELPAIAHQLIQSFGNKKVIAFYGSMGAGKTTLIKALCKELGVINTVSSPTFSIVNEYNTESKQKIYHFDFYRIKTMNEAYDMGYEDYFYSNAYCFIEWPEKISDLLPPDHKKIEIKTEGDNRIICY